MRKLALLLLLVGLGLGGPARADELDDLDQVVVAHPDDSKAYDAYALAAFKAKRWDDAIKRLKVGVARLPDYGEGYYKLAYAFRQKREWADAADYYRRYIQLHPQKSDPWFGLGAALQGLGDRKGAMTAYEKYIGLEKAPEKERFVAQAKAELARLDPARAVAEIKPSAPAPVTPPPAAKPDPVKLRLEGDELKKAGKLDEAAAAYQKAIDVDDKNAELWNELGNVEFARKRYSEAQAAFKRATERDPGFALAWYNLAHALRKGDKKAEAVAAYRQYIKLRPDDPDPYYGLGQTLKALGDVPGAVEAFRKYVGMEKRPEEQRWVEKAKIELEVLEAIGKPQGRLELRDGPSDTDDLVDPFAPGGQRVRVARARLSDLHDPFADDPPVRLRDLRDPFVQPVAAVRVDENDADGVLAPALGAEERAVHPLDERVRAYARALAAYRRALQRHVEDVSDGYERGILVAAGGTPRDAARAFAAIRLEDPQLVAARRELERARLQMGKR